jgi:hypothetical protein
MHFEWIKSDEYGCLEEWDQFLLRSPRGHFCQLSTWLRSFRCYGLSFSVLLARKGPDTSITGGVGMLQFGVPGFGYMCATVGPILDVGFEQHAPELIEAVLVEAERRGTAVVQFQFPYAPACCIPALLPSLDAPAHFPVRAGEPFINAPNEMLWVEFPAGSSDEDFWEEHMLSRFRQQTRRHIRTAERSGLEIRECTGDEELRLAYALIEANGMARGYPTRRWDHFGPALSEQVRKGHAVVLTARRGNQNLGAHYGVIAGRRYTAVMAGTARADGEGDVGHFLHWSAMRKARSLGLLGYDLTSSSVKGVSQFKMGFRPQQILLLPPQYFAISAWRSAIFERVYRWMRNHKTGIARVLTTGSKIAGAARRGITNAPFRQRETE